MRAYLLATVILFSTIAVAHPQNPSTFSNLIKPCADDSNTQNAVPSYENEIHFRRIGGQDAGNGGGVFVTENDDALVLYDFYEFLTNWNHIKWKKQAHDIELRTLNSIKDNKHFVSLLTPALKYFPNNSSSKIITRRTTKLFHIIMYNIFKKDKQLSYELYQVFKFLKWVDLKMADEVLPYCALRREIFNPGQFPDPVDTDDLSNSCDVYPIAFNIKGIVIIDNNLISNLEMSNIDKLGLIFHEVFQRYVTYRDLGVSSFRKRSFIREVVFNLLIKNDIDTALSLLKKGLL